MSTDPLITRYRPKFLSDVVGHGRLIQRLQKYVEDYKGGGSALPHLLFAGAPGLGKTTISQALCAGLYGTGWRQYTLTLNASDERGIDVIRGRVKDFAKSVPYEQAFNIVILDECDNLTPDAQAALRMTMEEYASICRFILCCNYPNKVIDAIKDRCANFYFQPLNEAELHNIISQVMKSELIGSDTPEGAFAIARKAGGSVRKALNILSQLPSKFSIEDVEALSPEVNTTNLKAVLSHVFSGGVDFAEKQLLYEFSKGTPPSDIFEAMFDLIDDSPLKRKAKFKVLELLAKAEYRVLFGCSPQVQLRALLRSLALLKDSEE